MLTHLPRSSDSKSRANLSLAAPKMVAPTADVPVLICLSAVLLFTAIVVWTVIRLTRPVIVPNAGLAGFQREWRVRPPTLSVTAWEDDAERAAIDVAARENALLGEGTASTLDQPEQLAPSPSQALVALARKPATVSLTRKPKHMRAATVRMRYASQRWYTTWAYSPFGNNVRPSNDSSYWSR
jgi:hypothetical protein